MPDELDLVRSYRSDIPGPSTDAWARARAALAEVSGDAPHRGDDKPRGWHGRRLTIGAFGAASAVAVVVSVLMLGGSATAAFAGWSATPSYPTAEQTAATQTGCQPSLPDALAQGSWSQVATDVRGPYTMAVYESGTTLASCLIGPSFTSVQAESLTSDSNMVSAGQGPAPASPTGSLLSGGDIEQLLVSHESQAGNGPYTVAEGRFGDQTVSAVTLVLSDGEDVTATIGNGWLVAWWPGGEDVTAAKITSASATTTDPLSHLAFPTPPTVPGSKPPGMATVVPAGGGATGSPSSSSGGP